MRVGEAFPSTYLRADDLKGNRVAVTIARVEVEKIGDDHKPVVWFAGKEKGLVLNKTNASIITDVLGTDETDEWRGRAIVIYPTKTEFQGKRVPCIRVADTPPAAGKAPAPAPKPEPEQFQADDSDLPF